MQANLAGLKCVCDEIVSAIKSAESSAIFLLVGDIGAGKTTLVREFAEYVGIKDSVTSPTFSLLHIYSAGNSVLGMQFRTCENFQASTDLSLVESPKISTNTKATPQSLPLRFCESQNLVKNQSREAQPLKASSGEGEGVVREGEGSDFAIQAPAPSLKENARGEKGEFNADLSAQWRKAIDSVDFADSALTQNLGKNSGKVAESKRDFSPTAKNDKIMDCHADSANLLAMTENKDFAESSVDSAKSQNLTLFPTIYHYDLYQKGVDYALDLGLLDLLEQRGIHFVEWGDRRLFEIIKDAFENIFILQITKAKNDRIYELKREF